MICNSVTLDLRGLRNDVKTRLNTAPKFFARGATLETSEVWIDAIG